MVLLPADLRQSDNVITEVIRVSKSPTEIQGLTSLEFGKCACVCVCTRVHTPVREIM